jgi:hypothetical protein
MIPPDPGVTDSERTLARAVQQAEAKVRKALERFEEDPADKTAKPELLRLYAVELNQPSEALKYLDESDSQVWRTYLPLAAKSLEDTSEALCLELGKWYAHLAKDAGKAGKCCMLRRALSFNGKGCLDLGNPPSLDPSLGPMAIEAWVKPEGDGVIIAHGGNYRGYALGVSRGVPSFFVRTGTDALAAVRGKGTCVGRWTHIVAVIADGKASLYVDGRLAGSDASAASGLGRPGDGIQVGRDNFVRVNKELPAFRGLICRIRIRRELLGGPDVAKLFRDK